MALIACSECGREISDKAAACPHCGNPMREVPPPLAASTPRPVAITTAPGHAVTTESTGKAYKALQAIGVVLIVLGVVSCSMRTAGGYGAQVWLWFIGLILYVIGRLGAWWKHG